MASILDFSAFLSPSVIHLQSDTLILWKKNSKGMAKTDGLIQQYQSEVTALYNKRIELSRHLANQHCTDYIEQHRRLLLLDAMYTDTAYALKLLIRSKEGRNKIL